MLQMAVLRHIAASHVHIVVGRGAFVVAVASSPVRATLCWTQLFLDVGSVVSLTPPLEIVAGRPLHLLLTVTAAGATRHQAAF